VAIWSILWAVGLFCGHLVYFFRFGMLKSLATLLPGTMLQIFGVEDKESIKLFIAEFSPGYIGLLVKDPKIMNDCIFQFCNIFNDVKL
jgi:hypothetical protein